MTPTSDGTSGLDGVTAATSAVSSIVGDALTYRGYDINELVERSSFEEVSSLLWYGELPAAADLIRFTEEVRMHRILPPQVEAMIRSLPAQANAMAILRTAVSALSLYEPHAENDSADAHVRVAGSILARIPTIIATLYRAREGLPPVFPQQNLDEPSYFLTMVHGEPPSPDRARDLGSILIAHADHELNASTFAARVAASTLADVHSAVVAGLSTLKGALHGGAGEAVMRMLNEIGDEARVPPYLAAKLQEQQRVAGFGHRVYRSRDPRATILKAIAARLAKDTGNYRWYDISCALEERMLLETGLLANVDLYSASVYACMGLPSYLFTSLFAMSRVSGWIAHILEQYDNNRLIRPRAEYIGAVLRPYVPLEER